MMMCMNQALWKRTAILLPAALLALCQLFNLNQFSISFLPDPTGSAGTSPMGLPKSNITHNQESITTKDKNELRQPVDPTKRAILEQFDPRSSIRPLWQCAKPAGLNKLIFVHIYKTAGTTLRILLKQYGQKCKRGVTLLPHCSDVKLPVNSSSAAWGSCRTDWVYNRDGVSAKNDTSWSFDSFNTYETDIFMGHMPIGLHSGWVTNYDDSSTVKENVLPQYITFVREPVSKYISGRLFTYGMYRAKNYTYDQALEWIREDVDSQLAESDYYLNYLNYLLTPHQKSMHQNSTPQQKLEIAQINLVNFPVMIGVIEKMEDSLLLLQYVLDPEGVMKEDIQRLATKDTTKCIKGKACINNKSSHSTTQIIRDLQQDEAFMDKLKGYLTIETQIYEFALELHKLQVDWLRSTGYNVSENVPSLQ